MIGGCDAADQTHKGGTMHQSLLRLTLAFAIIVPAGGALALATPLVASANNCSTYASTTTSGTVIHSSGYSRCDYPAATLRAYVKTWRCSSMWWGSCITWDYMTGQDLTYGNSAFVNPRYDYAGSTGNRYRTSTQGWMNGVILTTYTSNEVNV
jgi:hypothetical protein